MKLNNTYFTLRHGETIYNKKDLMYPWPEKPAVPMTEKGKEMIETAAKTLRHDKIDLIFASDIFRARQTAKIISEAINVKPKFDARLRDTHYGIYFGKPNSLFNKDFADLKKRFLVRPEDGESQKDVKERVKLFFDEIEKKYKNKNILIISHGDPLKLFWGLAEGIKSDEDWIEYLGKEKDPKVGELRKL